MKKKCSYKNIFDVFLGVFFVSWMFFEVVLLGNKADILSYATFSGRIIVTIGEIAPAVTIYVFLGIWRDVADAKDFMKRVFSSKGAFRTILMTFFFLGVHTLAMMVCDAGFQMKAWMVPFYLIAGMLSGGLEEVAWRGFFFAGIKRKISPYIGSILIGFLMGIYAIPLWSITGTRQSNTDFALYILYCVFQSIILGCLYRLTECVAACVLWQSYCHTFLFVGENLIWGGGRVNIVYIVEMLIFVLMTKVLDDGEWKVRKRKQKAEKISLSSEHRQESRETSAHIV